MATAKNIRMIGLELEENITALKTAVDAVNTVVSAWELRADDLSLPADTDVKAQLAAYDAITKPANNMNEDLAAIRAVADPA